MPCYDLVPVIEFTVGPTEVGTSGTPDSLDLTGECDNRHYFTFPRSERISRTTRALGMHLLFQFFNLLEPSLRMMGFRNREIKNLAKELKVFDSLAFEYVPFEKWHRYSFQ